MGVSRCAQHVVCKTLRRRVWREKVDKERAHLRLCEVQVTTTRVVLLGHAKQPAHVAPEMQVGLLQMSTARGMGLLCVHARDSRP
eukprot:6201122-Pleurochrysis_carterae.AAC.4